MEILTIVGLPVNKEYYSEEHPAISNGIFKLRNNTSERLCIDSVQLRIILDDKEIPVPEFFVYRLSEYEEISRKDFILKPNEETTIDISFPFVYDYANPYNNIKIAADFFVNDKSFTAFSTVNIVIRVRRPGTGAK